MHGDPVAFSLEKVSAQSHSRGNPDTAIQRVPFFGSFHRNLQVSPRIMLKRDLAQRFGIEPQLGKRQKAISIDPCIVSADRLLNLASTVPMELWYASEFKISSTQSIAHPKPRTHIQHTQ